VKIGNTNAGSMRSLGTRLDLFLKSSLVPKELRLCAFRPLVQVRVSSSFSAYISPKVPKLRI